MIEKLLALAPKTANCKLHFFVPFNFRAYSFLPVLQILIKFSNTSTWILHQRRCLHGWCLRDWRRVILCRRQCLPEWRVRPRLHQLDERHRSVACRATVPSCRRRRLWWRTSLAVSSQRQHQFECSHQDRREPHSGTELRLPYRFEERQQIHVVLFLKRWNGLDESGLQGNSWCRLARWHLQFQ